MGYSIGMTTLQLNNSARWGFVFTEKCYLTEQWTRYARILFANKTWGLRRAGVMK